MTPQDTAVEAIYATGHWLLTSGRHADAAVVFRAMSLAAPADERSWLALGACHEANGQLDIAATLYELATIVAAPAVRCAIARGRALRALGRDDDALAALEQAHALALDEDDDELSKLVETELRVAS